MCEWPLSDSCCHSYLVLCDMLRPSKSTGWNLGDCCSACSRSSPLRKRGFTGESCLLDTSTQAFPLKLQLGAASSYSQEHFSRGSSLLTQRPWCWTEGMGFFFPIRLLLNSVLQQIDGPADGSVVPDALLC